MPSIYSQVEAGDILVSSPSPVSRSAMFLQYRHSLDESFSILKKMYFTVAAKPYR